MSKGTFINVCRFGLLLVLLAIWEWGWDLRKHVSWIVPTLLDPYFISKPSLIWTRFLEMGCFANTRGDWLINIDGTFMKCVYAGKGSLWTHTLATLKNTFWGFLVGVGSGIGVGMLLGRSEMLAKIFEPYIVAFNSLPRVALVPLIIIMFGLGDVSKIVTALTLVFFVVFFNTFEGTRGVDRDHINAARFLGANAWQVTWTIYVPSALAWVFASLTPAVSFALIGVIVGEFIGSERGLGKVIIEAEATLQTADMMVALFVLMVIGVVLVLGVREVQRRLLRWQRHHAETF
ncbi:MAG: ABC transporter permease [Alphaproteobacteria bacterium]|nr:ABC transporter permease [Alphaproteobacteria bacterium]